MVDSPLGVQDPSALTTQQIRYEVAIIQRELESRAATRHQELAGLKELFTSRLDAIEAATTLRKGDIEKLPAEIKGQVEHLKGVQDEKFNSIAQQFTERDVRSDQATSSGAQALAAALQAAKELVGAQGEASAAAAVKSETSFTKQIDQIGTIIQTLEKALDARITELKERIDRGEGNQTGNKDATDSAHTIAQALASAGVSKKSDERAGSAQLISIIGAVMVFISIAFSMAVVFIK